MISHNLFVFCSMAAIFCSGSLNVALAKDKFPAHIEKFDKCITLDSVRGVFAAKDASWIELTHVQYVFFRQIYLDSYQNKTHAEPRGGEAAIVILPDATTAHGDHTAMIVFIDDGKVCSGMQVFFDAVKKALELEGRTK